MKRLLAFALTVEEERDVLTFDPWGERDATYVELRSGFVKCRKAHQCAMCFGPIAAGDRVWAKTETDDGKVATFRFCVECCWCVAHRYDEGDNDEGYGVAEIRLEQRWEMGRGIATNDKQEVPA